MNVTIIGGGNIGTQFAVHCASKGHVTYVLTSKPELFSKDIRIVDEKGETKLIGSGIVPTNNYEDACRGAKLIFVTHPAPLMDNVAESISPHVAEGTMIGIIPGTGGGECPFRKCVEKGCVVFGLQRVPSVSRLVDYGKVVKCTGYRDCLYVAGIPYVYTEKCCTIVSDIFDLPCCPLPNYLNLTLTPSNPILHTTRLYTLFKDYHNGTSYDSIPLFYEEWSDETSELLFKCDNEVQMICRALNRFDLSLVKSLKEHYESDTPKKLTEKIRSINSFKGIETPSIRREGKLYPDLESRYFTADFPFGLEIIVQIAHLVGVDVPNCSDVLNWYYSIARKRCFFSYAKWGVENYAQFEAFYIQ